MAIQFVGDWQLQWPFKKKTRIRQFDFGQADWFNATNKNIEWSKFIEDGRQNYPELLRSFNTLSEVSSPMLFWAENSGKVKFKIFEERGDEQEEITDQNDPLYKLLNEPNEYLGWNELKGNCLISTKLFGNNYINLVGQDVFSKTPTSLYVLPSQNTRVAIKGMKDDKFDGDFRQSEILHYTFKISENPDRTVEIPKEQILHIRTVNPNYNDGSFLYGMSPLVSAQYAVNSIYSGYSAKVGLYQNGPKTIFSPDFPGNSEFGSFSLPNDDQIGEEQKRISKYGLEEGQWQNIIARMPLRATQLSYNIAQLRINENNIKDFQAICAALGIDSRLLGDPSSSTFSNQEEATKKFYQGPFMAYEKNFFNDLTQKIRTIEAWSNRIIKPDFSDIPELAESEQDLQDILLPNVEKGLMTRSEYLKALGEDTKGIPIEFSQYYTYNNGVWSPVNTTQDENVQEF